MRRITFQRVEKEALDIATKLFGLLTATEPGRTLKQEEHDEIESLLTRSKKLAVAASAAAAAGGQRSILVGGPLTAERNATGRIMSQQGSRGRIVWEPLAGGGFRLKQGRR